MPEIQDLALAQSETVEERGGGETAQPIDIGALYAQYYRRVFGWCARVVKNTEDAQDLTQEAFVQVMRKIHTFRGDSAISTWLYRVVMNTVLMSLRRKRHPQISLDELLESGDGVAYEAQTLSANLGTWRDVNWKIDLERSINHLPTGFRATLILHDMEQYRHDEIAAILDTTAGTSKSQLHKARKRVRNLLKC